MIMCSACVNRRCELLLGCLHSGLNVGYVWVCVLGDCVVGFNGRCLAVRIWMFARERAYVSIVSVKLHARVSLRANSSIDHASCDIAHLARERISSLWRNSVPLHESVPGR